MFLPPALFPNRRRPITFLLFPVIVAAVGVIGAILYRASSQLEKLRQHSVLEATLSLTNEKVDRLDRLVIEQDNVVAAEVDVSDPARLASRWLPTAARETPTVRAVLVLDASSPNYDVLGFASRAPGPEDEAFRRLVIYHLLFDLRLSGAAPEELRHLHRSYGGQSYLISYWQRIVQGRRYLVLARHDVPRLVHDVFPRLYADAAGKERVNVVDEEGRFIYGTLLRAGEFTVGRPFPTTLYGWRLQVTLTSADELGAKVERRRLLEFALLATACGVILIGVVFILFAVEKERRLSEQKSEFVANASHELKTPLALVRMFAEMLHTGRVASEEKRKQYLQIMVFETERLTALIENVLDFARLERGKAAFDFALGDLREVLLRAIDVVRHRAEREGMSLLLLTPEDLPLVRMDARALELALVNLLDNAIKYARDGGVLDVRIEPHQSTIDLVVHDAGPGIPLDEQRKVFERFTRGRSARQGQVRGSGIGLSLVKHIAESHGGRVTVRSEPGRGATFVIRLPLGNQKKA